MAPDKSLAAEIEAVMKKHVRLNGREKWDEPYYSLIGFPEAAAEIAALQSRDGLIAFARWAIECAFDGQDADGADIQAVALHHGLLSKSPYDPEKHGPTFEAEPGDDWYTLAGPLADAALAEQEKGDA